MKKCLICAAPTQSDLCGDCVARLRDAPVLPEMQAQRAVRMAAVRELLGAPQPAGTTVLRLEFEVERLTRSTATWSRFPTECPEVKS